MSYDAWKTTEPEEFDPGRPDDDEPIQVTAPRWQDALVARNACSEAVEWAESFESFQAAWDACERGDWMLWWIGRTRGGATPETSERRWLVLTACACARLALPYVKAGELRPWRAIETAERWARQEAGVTLKDVRTAAHAASAASAATDAYASAHAAAATDAAYAAASAAYAAAYADDAAAYAASAAYASAHAAAATDAAYAAAYADDAAAYAAYASAYADDAAAARRDVLHKQCAAIVRTAYPTPEAV